MIIKKSKFKVSNKIDYDIIHLETEASQVFANDGEDLESKISHYVKKEDLRIEKKLISCCPSADCLVPIKGTGMPISKTYIIDNGLDDGYVSINGVDNTSTELKCALDPKSSILFKWNNINIPQGSNITDASIKYYIKNKSDYGISYKYSFSKEDNATMPTALEEFESKTWTGRSGNNISHYYGDWWGYAYNLQKSIEEIISRPRWESGNSILFSIIPEEVWGVSGFLTINSYELDSKYAAQLEIKYEDINTRVLGAYYVKIPIDDFDEKRDLMSVFMATYYGYLQFEKDIHYTISNDCKYINFIDYYADPDTEITFEILHINGDPI